MVETTSRWEDELGRWLEPFLDRLGHKARRLAVNLLVLEFVTFAYGQLPAIGHPWEYLQFFVVYLATASTNLGLLASNIPALYTGGFLPWYPSGVLWTLTVELSFYLTVPFIALVALRSRAEALIVLAVIFIASATYAKTFSLSYSQAHPIQDSICLPYMWIFSIGMAARIVWERISWIFDGKAIFWLPAYVALSLVGSRYGLFPTGLDFHIAIGPIVIVRVIFLAGTILSCAYTFRSAASILKGVDLSYGIYLWHMLFVTLFLAYGVTSHWWLWIVVPGCTVAVAYVSHRYVERPALDLKRLGLRIPLGPTRAELA